MICRYCRCGGPALVPEVVLHDSPLLRPLPRLGYRGPSGTTQLGAALQRVVMVSSAAPGQPAHNINSGDEESSQHRPALSQTFPFIISPIPCPIPSPTPPTAPGNVIYTIIAARISVRPSDPNAIVFCNESGYIICVIFSGIHQHVTHRNSNNPRASQYFMVLINLAYLDVAPRAVFSW